MQTNSSYGIELRKQNISIRPTLEIYRSAVKYLTEIYEKVWEELSRISDAQKRFNAAEHLIHTTEKNLARFDFDFRFPKMPSYLRRSASRRALGNISSYKTKMDLWEKSKEKGGKPRLGYENHAMPVFYREKMYREGAEGKDEAYLKLYDGHDWKWFRVQLSHTDMEYLRKNWYGKRASAPTLEKKHHKYFLRFTYKEKVALTKTRIKEQIICSVDMGINTDAVCSIMRGDGTVLGRKFIDHPSEKDQMYRTLGRIRRFQREHGSAHTKGRWAYTNHLNIDLSKKIAGAIVKYAEENQVDVIVFEYLEMRGKISGKAKQKLHLWRKRDIQTKCECLAHRKGIRISRICARNTSSLAYDGSGEVLRDSKNYSLCVFKTKKQKQYNCDLSASYNIGARYFIRELLKPLPATERSLLEAKVPPVKRRTSCVYADLRELYLQMKVLKIA